MQPNRNDRNKWFKGRKRKMSNFANKTHLKTEQTIPTPKTMIRYLEQPASRHCVHQRKETDEFLAAMIDHNALCDVSLQIVHKEDAVNNGEQFDKNARY